MTDLTKIEKPLGLCTKEEQMGLDALKNIPGALQIYHHNNVWQTRTFNGGRKMCPGVTYRQNPDWHLPKLDVPDWIWENSTFNCAVIDRSGYFYLCNEESLQGVASWYPSEGITSATSQQMVRLDHVFNQHNFNPHNIPWDQSLTKRPEGKPNG